MAQVQSYSQAIEVAGQTPNEVKSFSQAIEVVGQTPNEVKSFSQCVEVMFNYITLPPSVTYPLYPDLTWTYSCSKYPIWNSIIKKNQSGREVRVNYQSQPMWQWDITYDILRSVTYNPDGTQSLTSNNHDDGYLELVGFFNTVGGSNNGFMYRDPDFNVAGDNITVHTLHGTAAGSYILTLVDASALSVGDIFTRRNPVYSAWFLHYQYIRKRYNA